MYGYEGTAGVRQGRWAFYTGQYNGMIASELEPTQDVAAPPEPPAAAAGASALLAVTSPSAAEDGQPEPAEAPGITAAAAAAAAFIGAALRLAGEGSLP